MSPTHEERGAKACEWTRKEEIDTDIVPSILAIKLQSKQTTIFRGYNKCFLLLLK